MDYDEDEAYLLSEQEAWKRSGAQPAAKLMSAPKRPPPAKEEPKSIPHNEDTASEQPTSNVISEIVEKMEITSTNEPKLQEKNKKGFPPVFKKKFTNKKTKEITFMDQLADSLNESQQLRENSPKTELDGLRFDFRGNLLTKEQQENIPTHEGLHHHGEEPDKAGYNFLEIAHLARSSVPSQRVMILQLLQKIVEKIRLREYPDCYTSIDSPTCFIRELMSKRRLSMLIHISLQDTNITVLAGALQLLHILVTPLREDETLIKILETGYRGYEQTYTSTVEGRELPDDASIISEFDIVRGLIKLGAVNRLTYLLDYVKIPLLVHIILDILCAFVMYSYDSAIEVAKCHSLIDYLTGTLLPNEINSNTNETIASKAIKLLRLISQSHKSEFDNIRSKGIYSQLRGANLIINNSFNLLLCDEILIMYRIAAIYDNNPPLKDIYQFIEKLLSYNYDESSLTNLFLLGELIIPSLASEHQQLLSRMITLGLNKLQQLSTLHKSTSLSIVWSIFQFLSTSCNYVHLTNLPYRQLVISFPSSPLYHYILSTISENQDYEINAPTAEWPIPYYHSLGKGIDNVKKASSRITEYQVLLGFFMFISHLRLKMSQIDLPISSIRILNAIRFNSTSFYLTRTCCILAYYLLSIFQCKTLEEYQIYFGSAATVLSSYLTADGHFVTDLLLRVIFNPKHLMLAQIFDESECTDIANILGDFYAKFVKLHSEKKNSLFIKDVSVFPSHWMFVPISRSVKEQGNVSMDMDDDINRTTSKPLILNCLRFILILENMNSLQIKRIHTSIKFYHIASVFLLDEDIYKDDDVNGLLSELLSIYINNNIDLNDEQVASTKGSFQDLLTSLISQYQSTSFGDQVFSEYMHVFLQMKHDIKYRRMIWNELIDLIRFLRVSPFTNYDGYLFPLEDNTELLQQYIRILIDERVTREDNPLIYWIIIHHLHNFIFHPETGIKTGDWLRIEMIKTISSEAKEEVSTDVITYEYRQGKFPP